MKERIAAFTDEDLKVQVESVLVQVAEKDFNLRMEDKRFWDEISTTHTYLFDRQEKEIAALKTLTVEDFRQHFTDLFFSDVKTKRIDLQLTSIKHAEKQAEWTLKNS